MRQRQQSHTGKAQEQAHAQSVEVLRQIKQQRKAVIDAIIAREHTRAARSSTEQPPSGQQLSQTSPCRPAAPRTPVNQERLRAVIEEARANRRPVLISNQVRARSNAPGQAQTNQVREVQAKQLRPQPKCYKCGIKIRLIHTKNGWKPYEVNVFRPHHCGHDDALDHAVSAFGPKRNRFR